MTVGGMPWVSACGIRDMQSQVPRPVTIMVHRTSY